MSDVANLQNGELSPPHVSENLMELQHKDLVQDSNDVFMFDDDNEEMIEPDSESSDDESSPGTSGPSEIEHGDIDNILIGLKGSRFKYKV